MNTRRSMSSPMSSSIALSRSATAISCRAWSSPPSSPCLRSRRLLRRQRSIARCFAVAISHAPGLSGTPDSGHCSSAATRASCANSSARPTSRTIRARPAMILADSILQTASIAPCVEEAVKATHHSIVDPSAPSRSATRLLLLLLLLRGHPRAQALLLLPQLGGEFRAEVLRFEHLANLDLGLPAEGIGAALDPFDRLFLGLHLPQPETGDQLFRFGEGPVDHGPFAAREPDARAFRARLEPLAREHHAGFHQLFIELSHLGENFLVGQNPRFRVLRCSDHHHESHRNFSIGLGAGPPDGLGRMQSLALTVRRTRPREIDAADELFPPLTFQRWSSGWRDRPRNRCRRACPCSGTHGRSSRGRACRPAWPR